MKTIIVDTNLLMAIGQHGLDIERELDHLLLTRYTISVVQGTITELERIVSEQKAKEKAAALLALQILRTKKFNIIPHTPKHVDSILMELAELETSIIATVDKELKFKLKKLKKQVITLRQRKYLVFA